MSSFQLRLSVPHPPANHMPDIPFWTLFTAAENAQYLSYSPHSFQHGSAVKKSCFSFAFPSSFRHKHHRALQSVAGAGNLLTDSKDPFQKQNISSEAQAAISPGSLECSDDEDHKEILQRRRIGHANKGKIPWNKGRAHTAETRLRIKQRTREALRNPKIRKRMAAHPRPHSDQSKARIRTSLRQLWAKRRKWKQLGERFFLSWLDSISEAARKGLNGQEELNWDSYEKIEQEMGLQELQRAAEKIRAKDMAKLRAERTAVAKAEKLAMLAMKRKEREEKAKAKKEAKMLRKLMKVGEKAVGSRELKLKKLTKLHRKTYTNGEVANQGDMAIPHIPSLENWDMEFIKEKIQREVTLEEQIRAARKRA